MSDTSGANDDQARYWEHRSAAWIAAEHYTARVGGPFGLLAIDRLDPAPGQVVLDVGCGTGPTTVELARRVAPGGSVLGLDIAPSMLEVARDRSGREGIDNVRFAVGDAQSDDLGAAGFDAVFSQFGVMFFADPPAAFANLHRSLRDGGRLAFACWQDLLLNEWMFVPGAAAIGVTGDVPTLPEPGRPGPFSLADPQATAALLTAAGFGDVEVVPHVGEVVVSRDELPTVVEAACQVGAVREALEGVDDPVVRDRIRAAVGEALAERMVDGHLRMASAAHVVSATA